ncbi:STAS domain-containing protein [Leptolyngbya sp. BL0902]|uniref:STAS domain-containing protein n=1 Tax=Leptolyngbya sp. BL0902 TaxID=1115757 RepID=UPI0018E6F3DA|nr:STAS domain-containing protein [Leptolyngbya sp. BL0902]
MAVVQAHGSLNASNAHDFHRSLVERIQCDKSAGLVVDMSRVESLDSAGLISLVSALKQARERSKRFCLCSVPPTIRIIFELTQLDRAFEMLEDASHDTLLAA